MKTLFFSDVHGVLTAFRALLGAVEREAPDQVVFLGDLLTLGPSPLEVAELYFQGPFPAVRGNHDEFLGDQSLAAAYTKNGAVLESIEWTRAALGSSILAGVAAFGAPRRVELGAEQEAFCYHGSPASSTEIVVESDVGRLSQGGDPEASLWIGGHTHTPFLVRRHGVWFANSGSCGMPFFDNTLPGLPRLLPRADYVVVETGGPFSVTLKSVDLDQEALRREIRASAHPLARFAIDQYGL